MSAVSDTVRRHRPGRVERRQSGNAPSIGISPHSDFKPAVPQHADGMRIEPPVSEPSAMSQRPAASAAPLPLEEPPVVLPGCCRVVTGAVPLVLADHAPGELGQVGLADDDGACVDESLHGWGSSLRHVVRVDLRAVRRPDPGHIEQILDGERAAGERTRPGRLRLHPGDESVPAVVVHVRSTATASTSIFAPGTASLLISTSVDAGRASPKNAWRPG